MATTQELHTLIKQMKADGIKPSVGMLRAKSADKVTIQHAISALTSYQDDFIDNSPANTIDEKLHHKTDESLAKKVEVLEQKLHKVCERVNMLESQLNAVQAHLKNQPD